MLLSQRKMVVAQQGQFPSGAHAKPDVAPNPRGERNTGPPGVRGIADNVKRPPRGDIRKNWNDTEKISMAPAQG